ncbi:hypothetical protein Z517_11404 [Fonsecaea pedrosoi CBS 271.37]|uniref:Unplaced genomic scaffold supercont1.8, whole genome shotgun sequence n=1 Tax=Fonsecaea pedrosoi CBS 271.37 TaxID=1442368 RepID=A0A0D2GQE6_9EURO|nr:uncharacterized protein Z517_11404 [Fonsecaea pedrosoi CBS 271.37]KIW74634.1 hypothetical protein Z517_11404 [Fonsecaea pedrosoi CBS 271.37]
MSSSTVQLDPSILYLIIRQLTNDVKIGNSMEDGSQSSLNLPARRTLQNLRLTSRCFANMAIIKSVLFSHITLYATAEHLDRVLKTDFATFGQFVKKVIFKPSLCSPDLTSEDFRSLLAVHLCQVSSNHSGDTAKWSQIWYMYLKFGAPSPGIMLSKSAAFSIYEECAASDKDVVLNGSLQSAWIRLLKQFSQASSFVVGNMPGLWPPWVYDLNNRIDKPCPFCDRKIFLLSKMSSYGQVMLIKAVTQCLAGAQVRIGDLALDCNVMRGQGLGDLWNSQLQLNSMTQLTLQEEPYLPHSGADMAIQPVIISRACSLFSALVTKAQNSLQVLTIENADRNTRFIRLPWHTCLDMNLPALRRLCVKNLIFPAAALASILGKCGRLQFLSFEDFEWPRGGTLALKPVFDAIRQHPNSLRLDFRGTTGPKGVEFRFKCQDHRVFGEPEPLPGNPEGEYEMQTSLRLYLAGQGEWDDHLRTWFPST